MNERPSYLPEMPVRRTPEDYIPRARNAPGPAPAPDAPTALPAQGTDAPVSPSRRPRRQRPSGTVEPEAKPEREPSPRITLAGRLGTEVMLRTTPKGQPLGRFALAIPTEDGAARYETILVFGDRVARVQEFHKGDAVEVVGYLHEREVTGRDGASKTRREVYATVVRAR